MLTKILNIRINIIILLLWLVVFYKANFLPAQLLLGQEDFVLFFVLFFLMLFSFMENGKLHYDKNKYFNISLGLLIIFAIINCFVCYNYRHQRVFETLIHWSPIFMIFLYYPFKKLKYSIADWEKILYILFLIVITINIIMNIFPTSNLFRMTSGSDKFEIDLRVRVFGDGILFLGNIICLNRLLVGERMIKNGLLYLISLFLIFLTGFRMIDVACLIVFFFMLVKFKRKRVKYFAVSSIVALLLLSLLPTIPAVQERIEEMTERTKSDNFESDDYVRVVLVGYYYTNYFKDDIEFFFGSGMVQRKITVGSYNKIAKSKDYKSEYSKEVSYMSDQYHFHPVDMGLIGLSWEAGIPAVLILLSLLLYLMKKQTEPRYYYISAWAFFLVLICWNNPKMYHHHNMIYFTIILVIFDKILSIERRKAVIAHHK